MNIGRPKDPRLSRVVRAFAEGSLLAFGLGLTLLLGGLPIVLGLRAVHAALSWLLAIVASPALAP